MTVFFSQLINGLSLGSIYALIALGYSMVYGIILLLNFAHGDADHGCDPGYLKHTDHTREYIPMIALGKKVKPVNLGTRAGFCYIAATVTELLGVPYQTPGRSFAAELV